MPQPFLLLPRALLVIIVQVPKIPTGAELSVEEGNLLSVAYMKEEGRKKEVHMALAKDYRCKVEDEHTSICTGILNIFDANLILTTVTSESKVFYLKMNDDYYQRTKK